MRHAPRADRPRCGVAGPGRGARDLRGPRHRPAGARGVAAGVAQPIAHDLRRVAEVAARRPDPQLLERAGPRRSLRALGPGAGSRPVPRAHRPAARGARPRCCGSGSPASSVLDPARAEAPESRQNESLGLVEAELLRRFNARLGDRFPLRAPYINVVRDHLMRPALFGAPDAKRIGVPAEYADWVVQRSEQMVRDVRDLGDRIDVIGSADELAAAITLAEKAPSDLSDSELLEAALDAWVRQMENVEARRRGGRRQDPVGAGGAPEPLRTSRRPDRSRGCCAGVAEAVFLVIGQDPVTGWVRDRIWASRERLLVRRPRLPARKPCQAAGSSRRPGGRVRRGGDHVVPPGASGPPRDRRRVSWLRRQGLHGADPDVLATAVSSLSPAPVHVLHPVGAPALLTTLAWQDELRRGSTMTFPAFAADERALPDPTTALDPFLDLLPPEQLHLVVGATPETLARRTAEVLGVDPGVARRSGRACCSRRPVRRCCAASTNGSASGRASSTTTPSCGRPSSTPTSSTLLSVPRRAAPSQRSRASRRGSRPCGRWHGRLDLVGDLEELAGSPSRRPGRAGRAGLRAAALGSAARGGRAAPRPRAGASTPPPGGGNGG